MFKKFSLSWTLLKASGTVLMQDQKLLLFPVLSSFATLFVSACFILPMLGRAFDGALGGGTSPVAYFFVFLLYLSQYFVMFFFNAALMGAAMIRMDGGSPTVKAGLNIAIAKIGPIFGYAIIAATVGLILRAIQERVGFIGKIIVGMLGVGWTLATYMVVPVLVAQNVGPIDAVKQSAEILKKNWGENVIGQAGIGMAFGIIQLAVLIIGIVLILGAAMTQNMALVVAVVVLVFAAMVITVLVHGALSQIYAAALYRFATTGQGCAGFDTNALQLAFATKK